MSTTWIQLNTAFGGFASGTTVQTDDTYTQVQSLLNAGLAVKVANPGGTPPVYTPGVPQLAKGAQATAAVAGAEGALDLAGNVTFTALASGMAAGVLGTITFSTPLAATPHAIVLQDRASTVLGVYVSAKSATGFTISSKNAATASQSIPVDFHVIP